MMLNKRLSILILFILMFFLYACSSETPDIPAQIPNIIEPIPTEDPIIIDEPLTCDPGYHEQDDECVEDEIICTYDYNRILDLCLDPIINLEAPVGLKSNLNTYKNTSSVYAVTNMNYLPDSNTLNFNLKLDLKGYTHPFVRVEIVDVATNREIHDVVVYFDEVFTFLDIDLEYPYLFSDVEYKIIFSITSERKPHINAEQVFLAITWIHESQENDEIYEVAAFHGVDYSPGSITFLLEFTDPFLKVDTLTLVAIEQETGENISVEFDYPVDLFRQNRLIYFSELVVSDLTPGHLYDFELYISGPTLEKVFLGKSSIGYYIAK